MSFLDSQLFPNGISPRINRGRRQRLTPVRRLMRRPVRSDRPLIVKHIPNPNLPTDSDTFLVVSWNIEDGLDIDGAIKGLTQNENLADADVICLQEMESQGVQAIAEQLQMNYAYVESSKDERTNRGFGNAILSNHELKQVQVVPLPYVAKAYGRPRSALSATIAWNDINVTTWCVHTEIPSLGLHRRQLQYTTIAAHAIKTNPEHLLIAGDFNTSTATAVAMLDELFDLFDLYRVTARAGPSLLRAGRPFHLDHIYARGFGSAASGVESKVIASDHFPLWAQLSLSEETD